MDWFSFISNIIWPLTILILVLLFRKEISYLVFEHRLERIKFKNFEIEFAKTIGMVKYEAKEAEIPILEDVKISEKEKIASIYGEEFSGLLDISPNVAFIITLSDLDNALIKTGKRHNITNKSTQDVITELIKINILSGAELKIYNELRGLGTRVFHETGLALTKEQALEYRKYVVSLIEKLNAK